MRAMVKAPARATARWTTRLVLGLIITMQAGPAIVYASFRILDQSASATGQAAAFIAQADDPSAIYYNPAGMTQLRGVQFSIGTNLIGGGTSFTSPSGATANGDFGGSIANPPPSNLYLTANLKDLGVTVLGDMTVGLAVVAPFGTNVRWPENGPFATALTRQTFELIDIKPTVAYKVNDHLSLGFGVDIYTFSSIWGKGQAVTKFNSSGGPGLPPAGTPLEINGKDTAAGLNASLLYSPFRNTEGKPLLNVGLQYRSQAVLSLDGQFLANGSRVADASTTVVLPQILTGGVAYWPVRNQDHDWKLEVDVDFAGWHSFRNTDVNLSNGSTIGIPRNWTDTFRIMLGTEYKWLRLDKLPEWEVALRGGYWYAQTAVPSSTFSPGIPDANNNAVSIGLGLLCKEKGHFLGLIECGSSSGGKLRPKAIGLDLAYQVLLYETRSITGNQQPLAIPGVVNGTYQTTIHVGAINLRVNF